MLKYSVVFSVLIATASCVTPSTPGERVNKPVPAVTQDMSLEDAIGVAIEFGGDTGRKVKKLIDSRKQWTKAEKILYQELLRGSTKYEGPQLTNAMMIYLAGPVTPKAELFKKLVSSEKPVAHHLAWQMAAALPGKVMRSAMEAEINRALFDDDEGAMLIPAMAHAVQDNRMTSAYSVVRQGLLSTNHESFALAMTTLDPEKATGDLLEYLSMCPPEELRQMTISSVNLFAATIALNHMMKYPPNQSHAQIETLFFYAISRNAGLSDVATSLIEALAAKNQAGMAITLSRMPVWAQIAYIEGARRNMTTPKRIFLGELKKVVAQSEVVDELGEISL
jgi:hypothetical protein